MDDKRKMNMQEIADAIDAQSKMMDKAEVQRILDEPIKNSIWLNSSNTYVGNNIPDEIRSRLNKIKEDVYRAIDIQIHRMLDLGFAMDEIEITHNGNLDGYTIQVRAKVAARRVTDFEITLERMLPKKFIDAIMKYISVNRDVSPHMLVNICGLTRSKADEIINNMWSKKWIVVTKDLFHNCSKLPVATIEVKEGEPKPLMSECPGCEQPMEAGTGWWGGYRYMIREDIQEQIIEVMNER